jgi:hypothetical protein
MKKLYYYLQNKLYYLVRPLFVDTVDPNEDYICMYCQKPVLKRYLYCSLECDLKDEEEMKKC